MVRLDRSVSLPVEFFKVYLSCFSSGQLILPPSFAALLNGEIPKRATIRDHSGKVWNVMLEMLERNLIITHGWEDIARHHSLEDADFLVFKYNGSSHFDVELYGKNGLKKAKDPKNSFPIDPMKIETGREAELTCNGPVTRSKRKFTEMAAERTRLPGYSGGSQSESSRAIVVKCGEKVAEAAPSYEPLCPYFETTLKTRYPSSIAVPKNLVEAFGIQNQKQMFLCDENSRLWLVKVASRKDGRLHLYSGWLDFCKANNVRKGDRCRFEYICSKGSEGGLSNLMQVDIIHKKD
ncbi:hypothetical protein K2173_021462 [Erythroxylum novogranatense]|uniref:TF-B3 domain-containing protein n=1 Tax=Erythroxylum novogranatense TaxID=1862640 RepID=A0AAV8TV60_9ROSI|nr:hypothetical protein K2173_021462 [Erythroxylum novogranatense]